MRPCSPSVVKKKKKKNWNMEYIKHTVPWNTAVLHAAWTG